MKKDIVIYTAISGGYDTLKTPEIINDRCDYVCFSDRKLKSEIWEVKKFDKVLDDNTRTARRVKILPHKFFSKYKYSFWVDANIIIKKDIVEFALRALSQNDFAMFKHPEKRKTLREELDKCIELKKDFQQTMKEQVASYYNSGYKDLSAVLPTTYIIFRKHNKPNIVSTMEEWWQHILKYSKRDQLSLPYLIWKNNLDIYYIDHKEFNKYFDRVSHKEKNLYEFFKRRFKSSQNFIKNLID